ncbi:MAG: response regulator [Chitinivibrionales bacterium]|nr:response regulator [Chitinivibrionales bacterium]
MNTAILIVDTDKPHAEFLVRYFSEREFLVCSVEKTNEAEELLATKQIDIAIVEYCPGGPAAEKLCETVRRLGKDTELILMCGRQSSATEKSARRFAPAFYFVKPFNVDDLYAVVLRIAEKQALNQKNIANAHA